MLNETNSAKVDFTKVEISHRVRTSATVESKNIKLQLRHPTKDNKTTNPQLDPVNSQRVESVKRAPVLSTSAQAASITN